MKKRLFVVNTYFQLIVSVQLASTIFKNDITDIVVSDASAKMSDKINKIKESSVFSSVYFVETKRYDKGSKIKKYIKYLFNSKSILNFEINTYDEILFNNLNILTYSIIDEAIKKNKNLTCSIFDEGYATYTIPRKNNVFNKFLRTILFKKNIDSIIKKMYLFHPNLLCYKTKLQIEMIPNIDKNNLELKNKLNNIFDYKSYDITQKYIFFEESFFADNKNIDDYELICKISNELGPENIIIKTHPRNTTNRFEKLGIKLWPASGIPWELIQMNENFKNNIFLTISSGSILASKLYFDENIKAYFLYNCTNIMSEMVTDEFKIYLEKMNKYIDSKNIEIPLNLNEFIKITKEKDLKLGGKK